MSRNVKEAYSYLEKEAKSLPGSNFFIAIGIINILLAFQFLIFFSSQDALEFVTLFIFARVLYGIYFTYIGYLTKRKRSNVSYLAGTIICVSDILPVSLLFLAYPMIFMTDLGITIMGIIFLVWYAVKDKIYSIDKKPNVAEVISIVLGVFVLIFKTVVVFISAI